MKLRRAFVLTATLAVAQAATVSPVAPAFAEVNRAGLICRSNLIGFQPDGHWLIRSITNRKINEQELSNTTVPFTPISSAYGYGEKITEQRFRNVSIVLTAEGQPWAVETISDTTLDYVEMTPKKMAEGSNFPGRLIAMGSDYNYFIVDKSGNLKQWTLYKNNNGRLLFDNAVLLKKHMGYLKTLTLQTWAKIDGVQKNVLWGTTKAGALVQLQIPIKRPKNLKVTTVKKTGFKSVTALSGSACNNDPSIMALTAIEAGKNRARWLTLKHQAAPKASAFVDHGMIADTAEWRLRATY